MPSRVTKALRILPLGGLGEIGLNMMVIQYGEDAVIVDCGVMFADERLPGIDLIVPDFSYLSRKGIRLRGLLLTHGHEDHIGAIPFLLREHKLPIYGSKFTLALVKNKLREHELLKKSDLTLVKEADRVKLGPFSIEFIQMSHSIADALALAINTPAGLIVHTGDFKIDPYPADGRTTDIKRFQELGNEGVFLLMSDSTNVEHAGPSVSESTVYEGLLPLVREAEGWVILASFASHIPRIKQVVDLATATKRKILIAGRSMIKNVGIAREIGRLKVSSKLLIEEDDAAELPRNRLIILSTGTQGEPRSALARMAFDEHKKLKVKKGDRVIFSSRFIPGNERAIYTIINHLYRRGAEVFTTKGADVHVSGHAYRGDLKKMLVAVRPQYFVPVHGEFRHLVRHQRLAIDTNVKKGRAIVLEDGDLMEFHDGKAKIVEHLDLSRSVVEGRELAEIGSSILRDRRHLAETGLVVVVAILDGHSGEMVRGPEFFSRGVFIDEDDEEIFEELTDRVSRQLAKATPATRTDDYAVQEEVRICVRRFFRHRLDRRPVVIPIIMEV